MRNSRSGFTLIEIIVVIGIIALLSAILFAVLSRAREGAKRRVCTSNLKQIGMAFAMYAEDYRGKGPIAGGSIPWDETNDPAVEHGWMQQLYPYTKSRKVWGCPTDTDSQYSYFISSRAAYLKAGEKAAATNMNRVKYPAAFVIAGDAFSSGHNPFEADDADKDDYTQNAAGGPANGTPYVEWRRHNGGQNLLFADGHVKWFKEFDPGQMTFRYNEMHSWAKD